MKYKMDKMAPNAGPSDEKSSHSSRVKHIAEHHGAGMKFGPDNTGEKVSTAHRKDWGSMPYSQDQMSDGSMDYESVKQSEAGRDASRLRKHSKTLINRD